MINEAPKRDLSSEEGLIASLAPNNGHARIHMYDIAPAAIFKVMFALASVWLVIRIFPVILLVVFSLMLVATFNPMIRKLQAKLGRSWAIVAVVTLFVLGIVGSLALLIPPLINQGFQLFQRSPQYAQELHDTLAKHHIRFDVKSQVTQVVNEYTKSAPKLLAVLGSVVSGLAAVVTVAILTIYLLIEGPQVGLAVMRLFPRKDRLNARKLGIEIGAQVGGYMRAQLITSALAGGFSFVTLLILHVPGALALGALAAIADAIPLIGILIALLPAALIALTLSASKAWIVVIAYLVYHQLEDHIIAPKVYGSALGLSLSVIVISLLIGVELMGITGAVLALPVAAAIPSLIAYIQEWQETHSAEDTPALP